MATEKVEGFFKPEGVTNDENLPVRLVLCFDGTGDTSKGSRDVKNGKCSGTTDSIGLIYHLSRGGPVTDPSTGKRFFQYVKYFKGVATDGENDHTWTAWLCDIVAGATGHGYQRILRAAYKLCCEKLHADRGDEVFIFGFSRGAFISRALASFLAHVGLMDLGVLDAKQDFDKKVKGLLREYSKRNDEKPMLPTGQKQSPRVRFLGAFDTVKAVYPLRITDLYKREPTVDYAMDAPHIVDHFRHVLALNESRPLFEPDHWRAPAHSEDKSYEQAWFFGHHHDIGGGSHNAGLALWPLQWVMHAANDYGLVLDPALDLYHTLFPGAANEVKTPHVDRMKMVDMIKHHDAAKFWLLLNRPSTIQFHYPRNYTPSVSTLESSEKLMTKTFLHPSAYLIFDISLSFRIQIRTWELLGVFMEDRYKNLLKSDVPWWEPYAVEKILHPRRAAEKINILVYGQRGTGKSTVIGVGFGQDLTKKKQLEQGEDKVGTHDISEAIDVGKNDEVNIYYSNGWGKKNEKSEKIKKFIEQHTKKSGCAPEDRIHAIWYFVDCCKPELTIGEQAFLEQDFGDTPVHVILANEHVLMGGVWAKTSGAVVHAYESGGAVISSVPGIKSIPGYGFISEKLAYKPKSPVDFKIKQVQDKVKSGGKFEVKSFVHSINREETFKSLYNETFATLSPDARPALVVAQRSMIRSTIALANSQVVRAYTVWYTNKFSDKQYPPDWATNVKKEAIGDKGELSYYLMWPILKIFNMRFNGDMKILHQQFEKEWSELDRHKQGLCDELIRGNLIIKCMVDIIIVMTYAHYNQERKTVEVVMPYEEHDITEASQWYKKARQETSHRGIDALLTSEKGYSPLNDSIVAFQMGFLAAMETEIHEAETAAANRKGLWGLLGW